MRYSEKQFGRDLLAELERGYDPVRLARWAFNQYLQTRECSRQVHDRLIDLFTMEEGEEFHIAEPDLRTMAAELLAGSDEPGSILS